MLGVLAPSPGGITCTIGTPGLRLCHILLSLIRRKPVASLGLVSPVVATDRVIFFLEKTDDLFSHRPLQVMTFSAVVSSPLPPSDVVYPVFFLNLHTKNLFHSGVTPLEGVIRGGTTPAW